MLSSKQKNLLSFTGMVLMFLLPVFFANLYYYYGDVQGAATNQGKLISQPHNITELNLTSAKLSNTDDWQDNRWRIIYQVPRTCHNDCEQIIHKLQQVHIALGKNINRVQRINIHAKLNNYNNLYAKYSHIVAMLSNNENESSEQKSQNITNSDNIYIADPLGNIILSYQITDNKFDSKILKDAKKLLNLSKIG